MATTGTKLTIPFTVGTGQIVGQGNRPELWCLYTTDDATVTSPTWVDATSDVRAFSISRGRETELEEVDAGTATLTLDNRTREFDPNFNANIRPLNRWWVREQFTGETQDMFYGYAESYDNQWPGTGVGNAECVVQCADEFKVLALDALPVMSPPRDSYQDLVMADEPTWYVSFDDATLAAVAGPPLRIPASGGGFTISTGSAVTGGQYTADSAGGYLTMPTTGQLAADSSEGGDAQGDRNFTVEFWLRLASAGASGGRICSAPRDPGAAPPSYGAWSIGFNSSAQISYTTYNSGGGSFINLQSSALPLNTWHHIVCNCDASLMRIYVDGTLNNSIAGPASIPLADGWNPATVGLPTNTAAFDLDEFAFYRGQTLPASRIAAHYQAGTVRGYDQQLSGTRANAVLDTVASTAARDIDAGARTMQGVFMHGQDPLGELRQAARAEAPDGVLFVDRTGAITLLYSGHRLSSPYNTVQAVFGDGSGTAFTLGTSTLGGTDGLGDPTLELPYLDVNVDFSESFLKNEWNVTRTGRAATLQTAEDGTSKSAFKKRAQSVTDVPVTANAEAATIATALLAKYKDPMQRVTSLDLDTSIPAVTEAVFRRDIGDRLEVIRTPPGGGSRIDETLFLQKIEISGDNSLEPWKVKWSVSPV